MGAAAGASREPIAAEGSGVIGTQELHKAQGDYIVANLPRYAWFGIDRRGGRSDDTEPGGSVHAVLTQSLNVRVLAREVSGPDGTFPDLGAYRWGG